MTSPRPDRLTPEEAQAVVDRVGSKKAAARELGVPWTTFYYWLYPEKNRQKTREWRAFSDNAEKDKQRNREWFENLSGTAYNHRLLENRRRAALRRKRERRQQKEAT